MSNPHASNKVNPMHNGGFTSEIRPNALNSLRGDTVGRDQTVLTPACVLDATRELFGGQIMFDPCHAEGSLVNPAHYHLMPWARIWERLRELAVEHGAGTFPSEIVAIVRSELKAKDATPQAVKAARKVKAALRSEFESVSGHTVPWLPRTFINPPFGNRGPEVVIADFQMFCQSFERAEHETVFLCPARVQRRWLRRAVFGHADCVTFLDAIKFVGWKEAFPAPCALAYKAGSTGCIKRAARAFKSLGETYEVKKLETGE